MRVAKLAGQAAAAVSRSSWPTVLRRHKWPAMVAMSEVVVLVTSTAVDLGWRCDASASCNMWPRAQMACWARLVRTRTHGRRCCKGGRCRSALDGAMWVGWLSKASVHDIQQEKKATAAVRATGAAATARAAAATARTASSSSSSVVVVVVVQREGAI
eukprot:scaffold26343_cov59-Phaeocystis_antarctica.AAC.1